jgi:hypothetical protein
MPKKLTEVSKKSIKEQLASIESRREKLQGELDRREEAKKAKKAS